MEIAGMMYGVSLNKDGTTQGRLPAAGAADRHRERRPPSKARPPRAERPPTTSRSCSTCRRASRSASLRPMAFYIVIFAILAVVLVVAGFVVLSRRRRARCARWSATRTRATGHTRAPVPVTPPSRSTRRPPGAGASGGVFRKEGLGAKVKQLFQQRRERRDLEGARGPAAQGRRRARRRSADLVAARQGRLRARRRPRRRSSHDEIARRARAGRAAAPAAGRARRRSSWSA